MNLHGLVSSVIKSVNPNTSVGLEFSTGFAQGADFKKTPTFATMESVPAQIQPIGWRDLQQLNGVNLQGEMKVAYFFGSVAAIVRQTGSGGARITLPDGSVWLNVQVLEDFSMTSGWTKIAIVRQGPAA